MPVAVAAAAAAAAAVAVAEAEAAVVKRWSHVMISSVRPTSIYCHGTTKQLPPGTVFHLNVTKKVTSSNSH